MMSRSSIENAFNLNALDFNVVKIEGDSLRSRAYMSLVI